MYKRTFVVIVMLSVVSIVVSACGGSEVEQPAVESTDVRVQLSWVYNIEFSGLFAAEDQGYYADENLEVDIAAGGYDADGNYIDPVQSVLDGDADFGVAGGEVILQSRAGGAPIVAVASIYQRSPVAFISLAEREIVKPEDMVGQRVAVDVGSAMEVAFGALLSAQGIDRDEITEVSREDYTGGPLIRDEVDVMNGFITDEPVGMVLEGYEVNTILASDYGIDIYGDVFFTTEEFIATSPEVVERFLRATLKGYEDAVSDPEYAANLAVSWDESQSLDYQIASMEASLPLINPAGSPPGMMYAEDWETAHEILLEQGFLDEPLNVEDAFTVEFLDSIY